jgi:hypothetical protein
LFCPLAFLENRLDLPWYSSHCVAIICGIGVLYAAFSKEPIRPRNGEPFPNQRFLKFCFGFLGIAMIGLSLWGLWLKAQ